MSFVTCVPLPFVALALTGSTFRCELSQSVRPSGAYAHHADPQAQETPNSPRSIASNSWHLGSKCVLSRQPKVAEPALAHITRHPPSAGAEIPDHLLPRPVMATA